ncbi:hypothetical protein KAK06_06330 [Ideonella sp. 4Y11]|uniref:Molecular chaperone DnaJ n=1 Tax=Ideonella aquatica TaxID=2824119 RepID=A0A941BIH2_9BURK|nr:hypothetical protein [Ideonella aquatica]MBQ0958572.1 hypothetical protein [Ideonella aquatica]
MNSRIVPTLAALLAVLALSDQALAQQSAAPGINYPSVAAALKDLESRDGKDTVVTHGDGWTTVNEPAAAAQWSFPPAGHAAYPAVLRRTMVRGADGQVQVRTDHLCESPAAACQALLAEFAQLNERIEQAKRSRGRPPAQPATGG